MRDTHPVSIHILQQYIVRTSGKFVILIMSVLLASACATTKTTDDPLISGLLLSEPEPISTRVQVAIAHYTNNLYHTKLSETERAEILYKRGIAFDSAGLSSLARMDYFEAIKLNPMLAEAHNSIGVHYIQAGMYVLAYEAFDATLEINPSYDFALLNRGIALYYGGREQLASTDTYAYFQKDVSDPIRLLWYYLAKRSIANDSMASEDEINNQSKNLTDMLIQARKQLDEDNWVSSIVDFYLGRISESAVLARLLTDVESQGELNNRLCEAYFYLGKFYANNGNSAIAENYFKLSLSTNVYEFVEHKYARIELTNIRRDRRTASAL